MKSKTILIKGTGYEKLNKLRLFKISNTIWIIMLLPFFLWQCKSGDVVKSNEIKSQSDQGDFQFHVYSPRNIPLERKVKETFLLRNYVFFDLGSTEIPSRYELLTKDQVKEFKEDQLSVVLQDKLLDHSKRKMVVYYNILNILGDRMGKDPSSSITLVGSSESGPENGNAMAMSIKKYLVNIFGISSDRIITQGRDKPKIPSEQPGANRELEMLKQGNRRVSIESNSPSLLMEFQNGPDASLKPLEITCVQKAPIDSYVTFVVEGATTVFSSWKLELKDKKGNVQKFGPYTQERVSIPGKSILGTQQQGDFKVKMIGKTKNGKTLKEETNVNMVLWTPPSNEMGIRYSVLFEFNESKSIDLYKRFLTDIVAPSIQTGGTVFIHGYTDIIGDEINNLKLSLDRANNVKNVIESALITTSIKDVNFFVLGYGEDEKYAPFNNNYPEERFYNRSVIIDIFPKN